MSFIVKTAKKIRNNWKKSTFAAIVLSFGYSWTKDYILTQELMRTYCQKATKFGNQTIPINVNPNSITVILNPSANKRKAADEFEKYCAPLLHLAGIYINVLKTESEGHARQLVQDISNTDAIVVAGGDGTLCEVVTGLLRRTEENTAGLVPIGVLPLGRTNMFASILFPGGRKLEKVQSIVDATMAVVEEVTKPVDVIRIETLQKPVEDDNSENTEAKPIYAISEIKWGAYRDAEVLKDKYWYYGSLRKYATYLFNGYKGSLTWNVNAEVVFSPPCDGCSNCLLKIKTNHSKKWYEKFSNESSRNSELMRVLNPKCMEIYQDNIQTVDLSLKSSNLISSEENFPSLHLSLGPQKVNYLNFVKQGWKSENGENRESLRKIDARVIEMIPKNLPEDKEVWFSIDNDNFEVKPVKITLLPRFVRMFCKKDSIVL